MATFPDSDPDQKRLETVARHRDETDKGIDGEAPSEFHSGEDRLHSGKLSSDWILQQSNCIG
jgi:hypothetical protein